MSTRHPVMAQLCCQLHFGLLHQHMMCPDWAVQASSGLATPPAGAAMRRPTSPRDRETQRLHDGLERLELRWSWLPGNVAGVALEPQGRGEGGHATHRARASIGPKSWWKRFGHGCAADEFWRVRGSYGPYASRGRTAGAAPCGGARPCGDALRPPSQKYRGREGRTANEGLAAFGTEFRACSERHVRPRQPGQAHAAHAQIRWRSRLT